MQVRQTLREAIAHLRQRGVPSPELAAELLLMHLLGVDRGYLYAYAETELDSPLLTRYSELIAERCTGKPTQYITGHQEFWGLDFEVTPDVLIPRPETEHIVEAVIELAGMRESRESSDTDRAATDRPPTASDLRIADVGTGSGCIALALASELRESHVFATDISGAALRVATRNAVRLGLADRVSFVQTDLLAAFSPAARFDFIVSNPPYVGADELDCVQREVRDFEPRIAWGGTGEGEAVYRRLFPQALDLLRPGGFVVVEVGYNQAERVLDLLDRGWTERRVKPDLAGIPRVVIAKKQVVS